MYWSDKPSGEADSTVVLVPCATSDALLRHVTSVVGNFGGIGNADLAFYGGDAGAVSFYSFGDLNDTAANLALRETQSGLRRTATGQIVAGNVAMSDGEDHWFDDGPPVSSPPFDPDWRFNTGANAIGVVTRAVDRQRSPIIPSVIVIRLRSMSLCPAPALVRLKSRRRVPILTGTGAADSRYSGAPLGGS